MNTKQPRVKRPRVSFSPPGVRPAKRKPPRHLESQLQASLIDFWRRCTKPGACRVIAIPNGGYRTPTEAAILLEEGVDPGASDLIIILPAGRVHWCEVKTEADKLRKIRTTHQSENQVKFQAAVEALGHRYSVVRSVTEFHDLLVALGVPCLARPIEVIRRDGIS